MEQYFISYTACKNNREIVGNMCYETPIKIGPELIDSIQEAIRVNSQHDWVIITNFIKY